MSPRTPKQFKEIREEKRSLIMDTALEHFAKEGFHNTTINHIAKHAGISKGLMYNYFTGKDELLAEIIDRSVSEMYLYFDADRDGFLSEAEFELFIRKLFMILKEKKSFWQLFFQLMIQKDVMDNYIKRYSGNSGSGISSSSNDTTAFIAEVVKVFSDYFFRRKAHCSKEYDPIVEMNMCINTIKGFAMNLVFSDEIDNELYEKTINRIIETYK
jgi:AcrR family transcriptional regulator